MSVTIEQIAKLTDRHKIVVKDTGAPEHIQPVELELWTDEHGILRDSLGFIVRYRDGSPGAALGLILDIIEPPHEWQYGDVIGHPEDTEDRAVYLPYGDDGYLWLTDNGWMTHAWALARLADGWIIDPDSKREARTPGRCLTFEPEICDACATRKEVADRAARIEAGEDA